MERALIVRRSTAQRGTSLVEVLVTIVITAIGLLGLAGMQSRLQISEVESSEWCVSLQGAAELRGGNNVGVMIGARGCVQQLPDDDYLLTVTWEGQAPLTAPPASVDCGQGLYDGATDCTDDRCRRAVTTIVRVASLD